MSREACKAVARDLAVTVPVRPAHDSGTGGGIRADVSHFLRLLSFTSQPRRLPSGSAHSVAPPASFATGRTTR